MADRMRLALMWNDQHVADLIDATWSDFPWHEARIVFVNLTPEIRQLLEWLAEIADADELPDPPFDTALLENWVVRAPTGETTPVSPRCAGRPGSPRPHDRSSKGSILMTV
jgi:hypothetical protein